MSLSSTVPVYVFCENCENFFPMDDTEDFLCPPCRVEKKDREIKQAFAEINNLIDRIKGKGTGGW